MGRGVGSRRGEDTVTQLQFKFDRNLDYQLQAIRVGKGSGADLGESGGRDLAGG
jgi:hypothetical protein